MVTMPVQEIKRCGIVLTLGISEREIDLLDVGSHDEVYG